jgi:hypothetical protein
MQCVEGSFRFTSKAFGCRNSASVQPSVAVCYFSFDLISEASTPRGNGPAKKKALRAFGYCGALPKIKGALQEMIDDDRATRSGLTTQDRCYSGANEWCPR